jgi:hypothetical protein
MRMALAITGTILAMVCCGLCQAADAVSLHGRAGNQGVLVPPPGGVSAVGAKSTGGRTIQTTSGITLPTLPAAKARISMPVVNNLAPQRTRAESKPNNPAVVKKGGLVGAASPSDNRTEALQAAAYNAVHGTSQGKLSLAGSAPATALPSCSLNTRESRLLAPSLEDLLNNSRPEVWQKPDNVSSNRQDSQVHTPSDANAPPVDQLAAQSSRNEKPASEPATTPQSPSKKLSGPSAVAASARPFMILFWPWQTVVAACSGLAAILFTAMVAVRSIRVRPIQAAEPPAAPASAPRVRSERDSLSPASTLLEGATHSHNGHQRPVLKPSLGESREIRRAA